MVKGSVIIEIKLIFEMWEILTLWVESEFNHDQARFSGVVRIKISFSA